jgi:uncharacterized protein Yka (UPF0111/DUF47 family)
MVRLGKFRLNLLPPSGDEFYRLFEAGADLMTGKYDLLEVLRWRDICEGLESATDRAEDVANILEGIVLERA